MDKPGEPMPHRPSIPALALGAVLGLAACLGGCASAPHLSPTQRAHMGRTHVFFVTPADSIAVVATKGDVFKAVGTTWLFGPLGLATYVGVKAGDATSLDNEAVAQQRLLHAQDWPARIEAATRAALAQSPDLASAQVTVVAGEPDDAMIAQALHEPGVDSVLIIAPDLRIDTLADMLALTVEFRALRLRPEVGQLTTIVDERLSVRQEMVSVDGGKTWAEKQESGHKRHAMKVLDYSRFWFKGDPAPIKDFFDAAIPAAQQDMVVYFTDEGDPAGPLPVLQWVIE